MSLYLHGAVQENEVVQLAHWSIREFDSGAKYFVGFCLTNSDGRVSTAIVKLDSASRTGVTASGRRYELVGPAGYDRDAEYVWNRVTRTLGKGQKWRDVSSELIPHCRRHGSPVWSTPMANSNEPPITWRVSAYRGEYDYSGQEVPLLSSRGGKSE